MSDGQSALAALGLDEETLEWQQLALCQGMETDLFYDSYESDEQAAHVVDDVCLSCPVMSQCLQWGIENDEWGSWGGVYLTSGKMDTNRNRHKSPETWEKIRERIEHSDINLA